jgi:hypothetical protein
VRCLNVEYIVMVKSSLLRRMDECLKASVVGLGMTLLKLFRHSALMATFHGSKNQASQLIAAQMDSGPSYLKLNEFSKYSNQTFMLLMSQLK